MPGDWPIYVECGETRGWDVSCGQSCAHPSVPWATTSPVGNHQPRGQSPALWAITGPMDNHQPQGQPPALGAAAMGSWMAGSVSTCTSGPLPSRSQNAVTNHPPWGDGGDCSILERAGRAVLGCPCEVVLVVPAEQFRCWSVWPCLFHLPAKVDDSFLNHIFTLFFPPAPKLQSGLCTLISLCPSAAGAVASRHQY